MTRFSAAQYAAAAAAGAPRPSAEFADDEAWHDYQESWIAVFRPDEELPQRGDKLRRLRWKAVTRQYKKIEAARSATAELTITLVPAPRQPAASSFYPPGRRPTEASAESHTAEEQARRRSQENPHPHPLL